MKELYQVCINGKWGFINSTGRIVIEPRFDEVFSFFGGVCRVGLEGRYGYIDEQGKLITEELFDDASFSFNEGLAAVKKNGKWGYHDSERWVIEPRFDAAFEFVEGIASVNVGYRDNGRETLERGRWGMIDPQGRIIIPLRYTYLDSFSEDLAAVGTGEYMGYLNRSGEMVIEPRFRLAWNFFSGLASVRDEEGDGYGYINRQGDYVINPRYYDAWSCFDSGLAPVRVDSPWGPYGYIDKSGKMVIPPRFLDAYPFSRGMARVQMDSGYGFIGLDGEYVIEPRYRHLDCDFCSGLAPFESDEMKWGYIDKKEDIAIDPVFDAASGFNGKLAHVNVGGSNGWFMAADGGRWGWIDRAGEWVWEPTA